MRHVGPRSLLVLLTSAIAACGDGGTVLQTLADGAVEASKADGGGKDASVDGDAGLALDAADPSDAADAADGCPPGTEPDGDGGCVSLTVRRPFLIGRKMRASSSASRGDWGLALASSPVAAIDDATRAALAEAWLRDALEEHASIAAFARWTMQLLALGAPPALVLQAQRAGIDEVQHARACFALAARYGAANVGPTPLSIEGALSETSLAAVVALAAEEGCIGETLGAALALHQLEQVTDEAARRVLGKIARDEARHAELAWGFVAWAIRQGGAPIARLVDATVRRAARETIEAPLASYDGIDLAVWRAHGRVTCAEARVVAERAVAELVLPALSALLELAPPRPSAGGDTLRA